jgi:hypothetical protein
MCIPPWTKQIHQPNSPNSSLSDRASQEGSEHLSTCHDVIDQPSWASLPNNLPRGPALTSHRAEVASNLLTVFHADTSHGRRFLQVLHGQFLCFALIFPRSPQNSCRFLRKSPEEDANARNICIFIRFHVALRHSALTQFTTNISEQRKNPSGTSSKQQSAG